MAIWVEAGLQGPRVGVMMMAMVTMMVVGGDENGGDDDEDGDIYHDGDDEDENGDRLPTEHIFSETRKFHTVGGAHHWLNLKIHGYYSQILSSVFGRS